MAPLLFIAACGSSREAAQDTADATATAATVPAPAAVAPDTMTTPERSNAIPPPAPAPDEVTEPGQPDWLRVDEAAKKVEMDVVAGLTGENGSWNYNGYAKGAMTLTIPVGWTVVMNFSSHDANVPHSLFITDQTPPYPNLMPDTPGIPRAYSINLQQGLGPGKSDVLRFAVDKPGEYYMVCGVPGHAASGMWDHLHVSSEAHRPSVELKK
jgi:sulfocyanin